MLPRLPHILPFLLTSTAPEFLSLLALQLHLLPMYIHLPSATSTPQYVLPLQQHWRLIPGIKMLEWLKANGCYIYDCEVIASAAKRGDLKILEWLVKGG